MTQLKLPKSVAQVLADIDLRGSLEGWGYKPFADECASYGVTEITENRHTGESRRWVSIHELVIKTADGRLWRCLYERGLTEYQDIGPFENEGPEVFFDEVKAVEVLSYVYEYA